MPTDRQSGRNSSHATAVRTTANGDIPFEESHRASGAREADVRRHMLAGTYDTPAIIAEVARRLLASGDLSRAGLRAAPAMIDR